MKHLSNYLLAFVLITISSQCFAWGIAGHKISGSVATLYTRGPVKDSVAAYLGVATFDETAAWMETVRADKTFDYLRPFHYINIDEGKQYDSSSRGNIISELNTIMDELHNRHKYSKERIASDLKILFDLVGDLHQPLNVGYPMDRGGNDVSVKFLDRRTTLQWVWHDGIIKQFGVSYQACLDKIIMMPKKEQATLKKIDFVAWMNESRKLLPQVYDFPNPKIDEAYCNKNKVVIEKQLAISGFRLAEILNELFSK